MNLSPNNARYGMIRSRKSFGLIALLLVVASLWLLSQYERKQPYTFAALDEDRNGNEREPTTSKSHPIRQLISSNTADFKTVLDRQSKTLEEAVAEYRRRHGIPPPPNFDKWYKFAKKRNVQLIDEYDTIHKQLMPFWALEPRVIRERVREAVGFDNMVIVVSIRNGKITMIDGTGGDQYQWYKETQPPMTKNFVKYLPDMDLAFNVHDEPRVVMQHDDLQRHVQIALDTNMPRANSNANPINQFSPRPRDVNAGDRIKEYRTTRFNRYAHQATWEDSRTSCSLDTAARRSLNDSLTDDTHLYTSKLPLDFLSNTTAFSDICNTPSLSRKFGFFDRPNAFDVTHDLIPIFSQSKVSSFQDILYPSPWYFMHRVTYPPERDIPFASKNGTMYWRGSTTGGFSRDGGWRNQHRQRFVTNTMPLGKTSILVHDEAQDLWEEKPVDRVSYQKYFDVKFTLIGQCDPGDCDAQKAFFEVVPPVNMFDAFNSKYLLDIDGNAFSGRYYAWLLSNSLVYKMALFREWHDEWLRPWVHYVPLGIEGTEYFESVRFFEEEDGGQNLAERLALESKKWAESVLRNQDLEVWYFRLLLEYGRLVDDARYEIGFSV